MWHVWGKSHSTTVQFEAAEMMFLYIYIYASGRSLLIIPQCFCRLICMWLISVWRSCLWSAGRNPNSSVLHNLRDVLEITFPSPATHEKSVCHTVAPFPFQTCPFPSWLPQGAVCASVCVCVFTSMHGYSVWASSYMGADIHYCLFFGLFPYFSFSVFCFSKRWAQILL